MARFTLGGEDEGDGPSNNRPHKRQRSVRRILPSGEEEEHTEEVEHNEVEDCFEGRFGEGDTEQELERSHPVEDGILNVVDGSISVTLLDPEVLDCCICYEPLTIPIYQCENGHIACASCCTKLKNICASCLLPIGYNRCRAMEKVVESVRVACQNVSYGCKETFSHSTKYHHKEKCIYIPCRCPLSSCNFVGSSNMLNKHFNDKHKDSRIDFLYDCILTLTLKSNDRFLVLQEARTGAIFILNNSVESLGNLVTLDCIQPPPVPEEGEYWYDIRVNSHDSTLKFKSVVRSIQERVEAPPSTDFFLIPHYHARFRQEVTMDIRIR